MLANEQLAQDCAVGRWFHERSGQGMVGFCREVEPAQRVNIRMTTGGLGE